jgi:hypothetical protein
MDKLELKGRFTAVCVGPVEAYREIYCTLRDRIALGEVDLQPHLDSIPMEEKWKEEVNNLVVTVGKNFLLDTLLSGGGYTAAWFLGLVDNASFSSYAAADTMASHAGWLESTAYSNANRPAATWGTAASAASKSTSAASVFSINATATIRGFFMTTSNTKGGTTGTLFNAVDFTGGNRAVINGDTLNVNYTLSC